MGVSSVRNTSTHMLVRQVMRTAADLVALLAARASVAAESTVASKKSQR